MISIALATVVKIIKVNTKICDRFICNQADRRNFLLKTGITERGRRKREKPTRPKQKKSYRRPSCTKQLLSESGYWSFIQKRQLQTFLNALVKPPKTNRHWKNEAQQKYIGFGSTNFVRVYVHCPPQPLHSV